MKKQGQAFTAVSIGDPNSNNHGKGGRSSLRLLSAALFCGLLALPSTEALAAAPLKIGLVLQATGPFSDSGRQMLNAIKAYMLQNGSSVAGRKVELVVKDVGGPTPAVAKRLCQELVVRDKVDFIAGFGLTPDAFACAPVVTEAKKPMIDMLAATSAITTKSPYIARTSWTLAQASEPMALWAHKHGYKEVFTMVADYGPGIDAEQAFHKAFSRVGGKIVGSVRMPLNPEFGPYLQRVKDAKPQAVFVFLPTGELPVAFIKGFKERGLAKAGVKLLATGDLLDDGAMDAMGDATLGVISTYPYSANHSSALNEAFLAAYKKIDPVTRPNGHAIGAYDGMAAIYAVTKKLNGNIDGDKAMAVLKGMSINSPRGPVLIDPATRDIVQNIYVREAKKINGKMFNVEFDTFKMVKDPGK